jgi:hypothetical protein
MSGKNEQTTDAKATDDKADAKSKNTSEQDSVDVIATGSFHEFPNMTGRLLQNGETFSTTRARAVELRANGLISYADAKAEKDASGDDPQPSMDGDRPVITTRSIRRGSVAR